MAVVFWSGYAFAGYVDNGDGTITDTGTSLMWEKSTGVTTYTWEQAKAYCENLTLGGKSDWRLPTRNELQSLVDYTSYNPSISTTYFPDTVTYQYWTSTPYALGSDRAWGVNFDHGVVYYLFKTNQNYVRAVRGGQCGGNPCPSMRVLGSDNPKLENLRTFRDSTLAQSAVGRKVIEIYYNNADSINKALDRSPALRATARRILEVIAPMVGKKQN